MSDERGPYDTALRTITAVLEAGDHRRAVWMLDASCMTFIEHGAGMWVDDLAAAFKDLVRSNLKRPA